MDLTVGLTSLTMVDMLSARPQEEEEEEEEERVSQWI